MGSGFFPVVTTTTSPASRNASSVVASGVTRPPARWYRAATVGASWTVDTVSISSGRVTRRFWLFSLPLLLLVRPADRGRRDRAADHARDGDQRQHIGQSVEEERCRAALLEVLGQAIGERTREAEQQAGGEGAERAPVPEDQRRDRDEAPSSGHVLVEEAEREREIRAPE